MVVAGHVEPAAGGAEVGAGQEPEVLAAGVPRGALGVGQAVGDLDFLRGLHVVGEDGAEHGGQALGVGDPAAVGAELWREGALGHHEGIGVYLRGLARGDV